MTYVKTKDLVEERRIFKSVSVKKTSDREIPNANSETIANSKAAEILKKAQIDAELTVSKANENSRNILQKAQNDGFLKGQAEAKQKYHSLIQVAQKTVSELEKTKLEIHNELRETIIALSIEIAAKTVKREIKSDPSVISEIASSVLSRISPARETVLKVSPQDFESLNSFHSELQAKAGYPNKFKITPDPSLGRGDVVVQYERGTIDAKIANQLEKIAADLMSHCD